jgi:hypothetical protein
MHPHTPRTNEWAWTLANTLLQDNSDSRSLALLTTSLRAIYDKGFNFDQFIHYTWLSHFTIQRLQNWYLTQRMQHSYGRIHDTEAEKLSWNWSDKVSERNRLKKWNVSDKHQGLLEEFQADKHYWLKNFVEIIARALVEEKIQTTGVYESVRVYLASDADDIISGVDLIIECIDKQWVRHFIWVDVAVSENTEYLDQKSEKSSCNPSEFFFRKWMNPKTSIHRIVFALKPAGVSRTIERFYWGIQERRSRNAKTYSKHLYYLNHWITMIWCK